MSLINTIRNSAPGVKNSELILKAFGQEDNMEKAKYIRREGSKGNYKYYYKEKDSKGRVWTKEQETAVSKNDKAFSAYLKKKGIDEYSKEASDEWVNAGFQEKQMKILGKSGNGLEIGTLVKIHPNLNSEYKGKFGIIKHITKNGSVAVSFDREGHSFAFFKPNDLIISKKEDQIKKI